MYFIKLQQIKNKKKLFELTFKQRFSCENTYVIMLSVAFLYLLRTNWRIFKGEVMHSTVFLCENFILIHFLFNLNDLQYAALIHKNGDIGIEHMFRLEVFTETVTINTSEHGNTHLRKFYYLKKTIQQTLDLK